MAVDENGGEARTYAVDDDLILKVQHPNRVRPRTSLKKVQFFLDQQLNVDGVRVPHVIGGGLYEPTIEYTLMTRSLSPANIANIAMRANVRTKR
jgi:hypothetical protein